MSFLTFTLSAFAMVFVIEGLLYALFPDGIKKAISLAIEMPEKQLRIIGGSMAAIGFFLLWIMGGI